MDKPLVCIVGRPNVGKSTLFNTIVGRRVSITEDTPGVTRDRIYESASWLSYDFNIVDTGGLVPDSQEVFMKNILDQAQVAVDTADVILFIVDGKAGLQPDDEEIGNLLRRADKRVILVVNKMDSKAAKANRYDFYQLGLGEPSYISSEQSQGIGDLLDRVVEGFDQEEDDQDRESIRVTFIGKPNVGKSSLVNKILGEDRSIVTDIPGTTRDSIHSFFTYKDTDFTLVDTAGMRRKSKVRENVEHYSVVRTLRAIESADVCVLLIDATSGVSEQDSKIVGYAHDQKKAIIIAVNKWDLVEKDHKTARDFTQAIYDRLPFLLYAPLIFISAKTGQRVGELLDLVHVVNNNYSLRISTGVLNDILNQAVLMNQPPSDKGKRGKLYYGTQAGTRPPRFRFYVNEPELFHFTYLRYLENQIRDSFSFDGVPLIMELRRRK